MVGCTCPNWSTNVGTSNRVPSALLIPRGQPTLDLIKDPLAHIGGLDARDTTEDGFCSPVVSHRENSGLIRRLLLRLIDDSLLGSLLGIGRVPLSLFLCESFRCLADGLGGLAEIFVEFTSRKGEATSRSIRSEAITPLWDGSIPLEEPSPYGRALFPEQKNENENPKYEMEN